MADTATTFSEFFGAVSRCELVQPPVISCNPASACGEASCGPDNSIAGRIKLAIYPRTIGGTLVEWYLPADMRVDNNTTYQLQFARASMADQWEDVGPPLVNVFSAADYKQREVGQLRNMYYRVVVDTGTEIIISGAFFSDIAGFTRQQTRMYDEIVRREQRRQNDPETPTSRGYLLKLRRYGSPCPACVDKDTNMALDEHCPTCFGTGLLHGYYEPVKCFHVDIGNSTVDTQMDGTRGMFVDGELANFRYLNLPKVDSGDVWVCASTDYRWKIGKISTMTKINQLPLVCSAIASKLPLNHVVYSIPVIE